MQIPLIYGQAYEGWLLINIYQHEATNATHDSPCAPLVLVDPTFVRCRLEGVRSPLALPLVAGRTVGRAGKDCTLDPSAGDVIGRWVLTVSVWLFGMVY